jgi:hypothetical protein
MMGVDVVSVGDALYHLSSTIQLGPKIKAGPSMNQYLPSESTEEFDSPMSWGMGGWNQHDVVINVPLSQSGCAEVQSHGFDGFGMS